MLWAIVILLAVLVLATVEGSGLLKSIDQTAMGIAGAVQQWERSQRGPAWPEPQPTPTKEEIEQQKRDELEQQKRDQLRQQEVDEHVQGILREHAEGSGWRTGRIICHRMTDADDYEVLLNTADRTYTARGHLGTFYREGESYVAQPLQPGTEIRYALPGTIGVGLGQLLAENPDGRILGFRLTEERVTPIGPS